MYQLDFNEFDREVYEKELKSFLPEKMVDCHVHLKVASFGPLKNRPPVPKETAPKWTSLSPKEMTIEDMNYAFKQLFPDQEVTPLVFGGCGHDLTEVNTYVAETKKKYGYPTLYRSSYDMPLDELEENVIKNGHFGLKPYLNQRPIYIPGNETRIFDFLPKEQLELANKHGWTIMLHIPRSGRLKDKVNIAQLLEIEEKYPNVKLIVAHIGRAYSKEDIGDAFEFLGKTKNMLFDFTANLCEDAIKACIEAVGCKRLMFGSDLPIAFLRLYRVTENGHYMNVVPKGYYGDITGMSEIREEENDKITLMIYEQLRVFKQCAMELKLSDTDVEDILYGNAARLLKL